MHPDVKTLIELQQVDQTNSALTARINSLPLEAQALKEQLSGFLGTLDQRKARLAANQKERRELDADLQAIKLKIAKHREQLYQVKTNDQYRAMLKEIEGEEENLRKKEDLILEKMVEAEQIENLIREAMSHLDSEKARAESEVRKLEAERAEAERERDELLARRKGLGDSLEPDTLALYEKLRKARGGAALAEVRDGLCTGCHVHLRPQAYNDVRSSDLLMTCERCSRILFYVPPAAGEEASAAIESNQPSSL
ncbi:MAG: zinc ribbon domain-containing protein [Terriglobia bacterium]